MTGPICPECNLSTWIELGGGTEQEVTEELPLYHPNLDARAGPTVDIIWDAEISDIPLHNDHAERIKMMHFLQHLSNERARYILKECYRVLKPGGELFIMVGDFEFLCKIVLLEGLKHGWAMSIWGEQEHKYDFHKWGYTFETLSEELITAGFRDIAHQGHYNRWEYMASCIKPGE